MTTQLPETTSTIPGLNVLLLGATGTGKTHAIRTLVEAGLEVFVIFTEPGMEVLADVPSDRLHWHYIPPSSPDFADMISSAEKINTMSLKALSDLPDINKKKYTEFISVLQVLSNFTDQRTGQSFGPVDLWGMTADLFPDAVDDMGKVIVSRAKERADLAAEQAKWGLNAQNQYGMNRVIVIDSLTGLSITAMNLVTGSKPVKSIADWGIAIDNLERLLTKLCVDTRVHFVLIGHVEREVDEVTGGTSLMASTLGRKLAPKLPRFFSDVIHVVRKGKDFSWSTATVGMDLKARNVPISEGLAPSFVPIIERWRKLARQEK